MAKLFLFRPCHGGNLLSPFPSMISPSFRPFSVLPSPFSLPRLHMHNRRRFPFRALESSADAKKEDDQVDEKVVDGVPTFAAAAATASEEEMKVGLDGNDGDYPMGEFEMQKFDWWKSFLVKLRLLFALPWERVKKGSVLTMNLRGQLSCGWGKIEEIRRHIINFKKSGKFIISYTPSCGEKEYYLASACEEIYAPPSAYVSLYGLAVQASFLRGIFDKVGIIPEIQRIGKYKSIGEQLSSKSMSKENCEMLTSLLDNIYGNWLDTIALTQGRKCEEIEDFINSGVYQVDRLKEEGWITDILYVDEIISMLKQRLGKKEKEKLPMVDYRKYSRVRNWTLGLEGAGPQIAIIRASGSISRTRGPLSLPGSGIISEELIEKIRTAGDSKRYKAVVLRIDSPGGDALASDLMWREIKLLSARKPVIASMSDVAASGGYYMAMAAGAIVAEKLTVTGSIGVVTGRFSLKGLYESIGFNKEVISRGKYAELNVAEQRPLRPDEAELFAKSAQNAYKQFRDKAAWSRSMTIDQMEEVAQGRVWSGKDAASRGLVDAIGGFSRAVAIAKQKANIPQEKQVRLVELSQKSPSLPAILTGIGSSLLGLDKTVKEVMQDMPLSSTTVQARMDGILFEKLGSGTNNNHPILDLIKDFLNSF
ncbi:ClpP/crotonase protein [Dioscorea alata]|uniref:ClpP/crotonase protein n=1 Tax=Dioscorea alata TaxID=55571 RepID=A0ACB7WLN7_DIOAL|nr:ClpP/crotonase protein [Dioscorea alata]